MALLEVDNISLSFGGLKAINGLSFEVEERDIISLIGPNGAGKSTAPQRAHRHLPARPG